jgi:hypothetical protein
MSVSRGGTQCGRQYPKVGGNVTYLLSAVFLDQCMLRIAGYRIIAVVCAKFGDGELTETTTRLLLREKICL